jgi:hemolysin D
LSSVCDIRPSRTSGRFISIARAAAKKIGQRKSDPSDPPKDDTDRQSRQPSYIAHVAVAETGINTEQGFMSLEPGMAVTAEIKTGQRAVISYLLSPLLRYKQEGLRER